MSEKLKILYDATILSYYFEKNGGRSGIFFTTYNILKELLNHPEIEVTLYCDYKRIWYMDKLMKTDKFLAKSKLLEGKDICNSLIALFTHLIFKYQKNDTTKDNLYKKVIRFIAYRSFHIYDKFKKENQKLAKRIKDFDVYFSSYELIPKEVLNYDKIKRYLLLHDVIPLIMDDFYGKMNYSKQWMKNLINSLNKNDYYFTNSEYTKKDFIKHAPNIDGNKIVVTYVGANENFYRVTDQEQIKKVKEKYNIPQDKKYIFSLCTLEPRKNLIFAIKNFIEFIKKNNIDDFVLVLGGGHWVAFLPQLENAVKDLDEYKDKIIKIGYVDDEDLSTLYSGAEMFVFPSLYEGFGMPILEAMQCGCPVITSNVSSMPEVAGDAGILIDPHNDNELIAAYEKMYFDENFRKESSKKSLEQAKKFSWQSTVNKMLEVINAQVQ